MPYHDRCIRRWLIGGGVSLSAIAGYVNASMLSVYHVPVSHMSGAATRVGMDAGEGRLDDLRFILLLMAGFFFGAVLSGVVLHAAELRPGRRYGIVLMIEGLVLAAAAVLASAGSPAAVPLAAFACGVQNAMASTYYGLILRTTHVTGIVTDLGVMLGHRLRGRRVEPWKAVTLTGLLVGFLGGGAAGAVVSAQTGSPTLWPAAAACLVGGFGYWLWRHWRGPAVPPNSRRADGGGTDGGGTAGRERIGP